MKIFLIIVGITIVFLIIYVLIIKRVLEPTLFSLSDWTYEDSVYLNEYQIGGLYEGVKRYYSTGKIKSFVSGTLIEINVDLDRAIIKDNNGQYHVVSCKTLNRK